MLQARPPLEITDFGGGITDNDIPGSPNQYKNADNLDITNDLKLLQRPGSAILSSTEYQLPLGDHRVSRIINFDHDSEILAAQQKAIYYRSAGAWTEAVGPGGAGHHAFNSNDYDTQIHEAQWQKHLFLTSESGDKPVKMYRDNSANMKMVTAGLPVFDFVTAWSDGGLSRAITLVNDLWAKMKTHFGNSTASPTSPDATYAHRSSAGMTVSLGLLNAGTSATNLASLITLLNLLRVHFNLHIEDTQLVPFSAAQNHLGDSSRSYAPMGESAILNFQPIFPSASVLPAGSTIAELIPFINDLRNKWNYHTFAMNTHFNAWKDPSYPAATSVSTGFGVGATTYPPLVENSNYQVAAHSGIEIAPNYATIINYINDFKSAFDAHRVSYGHVEADTVNVVPAAVNLTPTILPDAVILLAHSAYAFWRHYMDGNIDSAFIRSLGGTSYFQRSWYPIIGDTTSGSAVITNIDSGANYVKFAIDILGSVIQPYIYLKPRIMTLTGANITGSGSLGTLFGGNSQSSSVSNYPTQARVTAVASTTITMSHTANASNVQNLYVFSDSVFHHYRDKAAVLNAWVITPEIIQSGLDGLDLSFDTTASLTSLGTLAKSFATALKTHTLDRATKVAPIASNPFYGKFRNVNGYLYDEYSNGDLSAEVTFALMNTVGADYRVLWTSHWSWTADRNDIAIFPELDSQQQSTFDTSPTGASYVYQFLYKNDYNVGPVQYSDFSSPSTSIQVLGFASPDSTTAADSWNDPIVFTQLPALSNAAGENYATSSVVKDIYRTTNGGNVLYRVAEIANATTTYTDSTRDDELVGNEQIYTTGGVVANDPPPIAKYIHILNNIAFYGNVTESGVAQPQRLRQSLDSDPDSCPADFFLDFDESIAGISSIKNSLIVCCVASTHRVSGVFDELGRGGMTREAISDTVGCINQESMVKTDVGVFWAGQNGFYWSDGYQVLRISPHLESTFLGYTSSANQKARLVGTFNKNNRKVIWTFQKATGDSSASIIWSLDLDQGIKQQMPFTTWSGDAGFLPTALSYFNGQVLRGTLNGYIFYHSDSIYMDPKVDTAVAATLWNKNTISWTFESCDTNFGTNGAKKYVTRITPQFKQYTNLSVDIIVSVDRERNVNTLSTPIRSRHLADWGDPNVEPPAGFQNSGSSVIDDFRRNSSSCMKCDYFGFTLKTGFVVITSSDVAGLANIAVSGTSVTATLVGGKKWPSYVVDYYIVINGVYVLVTTRTSDTVIVGMGTGLSTSSGLAWEIWGLPKNEKACLISYQLRYDLLGDKQRTYHGATSTDGGKNA